MLRVAACAVVWLAAVAVATAHESDFSTLQLRVLGDRIEGGFEIALRDARIAVGLDGDVSGEPGWVGLASREPALRALLHGGLSLATPAGPCPLEVAAGYEPRAGGRPVARLLFTARCPREIESLSIDYRVLRDLDPAHRGYFSVEDPRATHVGVFAASQPSIVLDVNTLDRWRVARDYLREGARHIASGWDHVLFLVALLLPAPLRRDGGDWRARTRFGATAREVAKVVTAFTLAHSLTLVLSVLGALSLPPRPVEAAIALSVGVAAWNNLRPFLPGRGGWLAFAFGLVHGFGFAGALAQLGLPRQAEALALLAFNAGVEVGQLAIVALLLPVLFRLRRSRRYPRLVLGAGSLAITWIASLWLIERVAGVALFPSF